MAECWPVKPVVPGSSPGVGAGPVTLHGPSIIPHRPPGLVGLFFWVQTFALVTNPWRINQMANANAAPVVLFPSAALPAVATGTDADVAVFVAPFDCTVTAVTYVANATITGADTNSRTLNLRNKGL